MRGVPGLAWYTLKNNWNLNCFSFQKNIKKT
jgi:hypothetical protein